MNKYCIFIPFVHKKFLGLGQIYLYLSIKPLLVCMQRIDYILTEFSE